MVLLLPLILLLVAKVDDNGGEGQLHQYPSL